ncbi:unnamed protein product [Staurois parvus]|uniref:Uncharacterized protein n=1 Tax=Staurois parvus TaxID=386267 RepID=A0ABN9E1A9_9NEOB|nr:unnamed protein product [Staurois parvus]
MNMQNLVLLSGGGGGGLKEIQYKKPACDSVGTQAWKTPICLNEFFIMRLPSECSYAGAD